MLIAMVRTKRPFKKQHPIVELTFKLIIELVKKGDLTIYIFLLFIKVKFD
jgi:hypothetical protein